MEIPTNLKLADKTSVYKAWACEPCKAEAVVVPINPDQKGAPRDMLIICPVCLKGFRTTFEDFKTSMAPPPAPA